MSAKRTSCAELVRLFLRLGATSFGGPAAHIANMHREVVERWKWLSRQEFLDLLGATNLIPGPNSTELAIHIGRSRAGIPGLVIAGTAFILPGFFFVAISHPFIGRLRHITWAQALLDGINVAAVALMVVMTWQIGRAAIVDATTAGLALGGAAALAVFRLNSAWLVIGGAIIGFLS